MAESESPTLHLTLAMALPLLHGPKNRSIKGRRQRPRLSQREYAYISRLTRQVRKAADFVLRQFEPHQEELWWEPETEDGKKLLDREGKVVRRTISHQRLVIRLRGLTPLKNFELSSTIRDGIHNKVADLLLSFAERKLDPATAEKTSYPEVGEGFPIVWQGGFVFYEHEITGKLYIYLPMFPRGNHEEEFANSYSLTYGGPHLRKFGEEEIQEFKYPTGRGRPYTGFLLPLEFDKWGEATFIRGANNPPVWKKTDRRVDQRWLAEIMLRDQNFNPKRVELLIRGDRIFVNVACEVPTKPAVEVENFMGVSFGLEQLITVVVINPQGEVIHNEQISAKQYQGTYRRQLQQLRAGRGGPFAKRLSALHHEVIRREIVNVAVAHKAALAIEEMGNIDKGKYSPGTNQKLSYLPYGKISNIAGYKSILEGLPKPYSVYSATVKMLCSNCGATNKGEVHPILLDGPSFHCAACSSNLNVGLNTALNLSRRAQELYNKGIVAK